MQKTGLLGGTFDPIHNAHILMAEKALKDFQLDKVVFLPSGRPPHKTDRLILEPEHRYHMVKAAIEGKKGFEVSDYEICKGDLSYTADTVRELSVNESGDKLFFILGGDSLIQFEHWYHPEQICKYVTILACGRIGFDEELIHRQIQKYRSEFHADIEYFEIPDISISSHEIRERVRKKQSIRQMVPEAVWDYIYENHLYL